MKAHKFSTQEFNKAKQKVVKKTKRHLKVVDREVHRKPWQFLGFAALFSAFFGFLLGRKSKRSYY